MYTHPLSLPEIVVVVGQFIPLWESEHLSGEIVWLFKPKSLLAAISVNRLFHATLTPFLWTVYANPMIKSIGSSSFTRVYYNIASDIVERNSTNICVLDLSCYTHRPGPRDIELLQLNCPRLQELRVSSSISSTWVNRLVSANSGLHALEWRRTLKGFKRHELLDFKNLLQLRQLRYLSLDGWNLHATCFYHLLGHNARHLEELCVKNCNLFVPSPIQDVKHKLSTSFAKSSEEAIEAFQAMRKMWGSVRLRKIKTLHLDIEQNKFSETLNWMLGAVPALETVVFGDLTHGTAKTLSGILRKYCPRLRTVKQSDIYKYCSRRPPQTTCAAYLVGACASGLLVHVSLDSYRIGSRFTKSLSVHRDSLETLELTIRDNNYLPSFENLGTILKRFSRLKHLTVYFYVTHCNFRQTLLFLDELAFCQGLVSLSFYGFTVVHGDNDHVYGNNRNDRISERIFAEPVWCELRSGSDQLHHHCCEIFRRLVYHAILHLPSLKSVVLGREMFEKYPPSLT